MSYRQTQQQLAIVILIASFVFLMAKNSYYCNTLNFFNLFFTMWISSLLRTGGFDCRRIFALTIKHNTICSNRSVKLNAFSTKKGSAYKNNDRSVRSQRKPSLERPLPQQQHQQPTFPTISPDTFSSGITASVLLLRGTDGFGTIATPSLKLYHLILHKAKTVYFKKLETPLYTVVQWPL